MLKYSINHIRNIMKNIFKESLQSIEKNKSYFPWFPARGVSFIDNFDEIILDIEPGDLIVLEPEPENKYDNYAVKLIHDITEEYIGHLPAEHCKDFYKELEAGRRWYGIVESTYNEKDKNPGLRISLTLESPLDDIVEQKKLKKDNLKFLKDISQYFEFKEDPLDFLIYTRSLLGEDDGSQQNFQHNSDEEILNTVKKLSYAGMDVSLFTVQGLEDLENDVISQIENGDFNEKTFTMFLPDFIDITLNDNTVIAISHDEDVVWSNEDKSPRIVEMNLVGRLIATIVCKIAYMGNIEVSFR